MKMMQGTVRHRLTPDEVLNKWNRGRIRSNTRVRCWNQVAKDVPSTPLIASRSVAVQINWPCNTSGQYQYQDAIYRDILRIIISSNWFRISTHRSQSQYTSAGHPGPSRKTVTARDWTICSGYFLTTNPMSARSSQWTVESGLWRCEQNAMVMIYKPGWNKIGNYTLNLKPNCMSTWMLWLPDCTRKDTPPSIYRFKYQTDESAIRCISVWFGKDHMPEP